MAKSDKRGQNSINVDKKYGPKENFENEDNFIVI